MGEMKLIAKYEMDMLMERLHEKALHRRNVHCMKKEVQKEAQELKKLLNRQ